jgi:hypothetical protein
MVVAGCGWLWLVGGGCYVSFLYILYFFRGKRRVQVDCLKEKYSARIRNGEVSDEG